jgi:hypothetical protein
MRQYNSMEKLTRKQQREKIAKVVKVVCKELDILPSQVTVNDLLDLGVSDYALKRAGGLRAILLEHFNTQTPSIKKVLKDNAIMNLIRKDK